MIGDHKEIGTTTLNGVGNQRLSTSATTVQLSLSSLFDGHMEQCDFEAAVLSEITNMPQRDHTQAIKTVLEVLRDKMPEFMAEHAHYINIDRFQTGYQAGDVSLLLGIPQLSIHPKVIIQFSNGPAIAMIRQPTQSHKFLLLAGPARSAEFLKKARVEVEKDTVKKYGKGHSEEDAQTHEVHCVGNKHVQFSEYNSVKGDSGEEEDDGADSEQDSQGEDEEKEQEQDEECKYTKWVQREGRPHTKPVKGDEVMVNYTSTLSDGSKMDNTYEHQPYTFIVGITPTTKGFEAAVSSMNLNEKAQFVIPHKWMYGKAGIPSNVPPGTNFTFDIHFIENKKHKKGKERILKEEVTENEVGLHVEHEQDKTDRGVLHKASDIALVNIAMTAAKTPQEELTSSLVQPNPQIRASHHKILPFLAKGPQIRHKT